MVAAFASKGNLTMKVKLTTSLSGVNGAYSSGDEYECASPAEAERLIAAGYAEPIAAAPGAAREKAVARPRGKETRLQNSQG